MEKRISLADFGIDKELQARKKAKARLNSSTDQLAAVKGRLAEILTRIPKQKKLIQEKMVEGADVVGAQVKLKELKNSIVPVEDLIGDLAETVNIASTALEEIDKNLQDLIQLRSMPMYNELRKKITTMIEEALDLAESWIPALQAAYEEVGLDFRGAHLYPPYVYDFETKFPPRFKNLYR